MREIRVTGRDKAALDQDIETVPVSGREGRNIQLSVFRVSDAVKQFFNIP